jgi:hypothetical protein
LRLAVGAEPEGVWLAPANARRQLPRLLKAAPNP